MGLPALGHGVPLFLRRGRQCLRPPAQGALWLLPPALAVLWEVQSAMDQAKHPHPPRLTKRRSFGWLRTSHKPSCRYAAAQTACRILNMSSCRLPCFSDFVGTRRLEPSRLVLVRDKVKEEIAGSLMCGWSAPINGPACRRSLLRSCLKVPLLYPGST